MLSLVVTGSLSLTERAAAHEQCDAARIAVCPALAAPPPAGSMWMYVSVVSSQSGVVAPPAARLRFKRRGESQKIQASPNPHCFAVAVRASDPDVELYVYVKAHFARFCTSSLPSAHFDPARAFRFDVYSSLTPSAPSLERLTSVPRDARGSYIMSVVGPALDYQAWTGEDVLSELTTDIAARPEVIALEYVRSEIDPGCTSDCLDADELADLQTPFHRWIGDQHTAIDAQIARERYLATLPDTPQNRIVRGILADTSPRAAFPLDDTSSAAWRRTMLAPTLSPLVGGLSRGRRIELIDRIRTGILQSRVPPRELPTSPN